MKPRLLLPIAILLLLFSSATARADKVDDYIKAEMKKRQIPGVALAIIKDDKILKMKGYGLANMEHNVAVTPDTVFDIASATKPFTATAILMLVEEGRIGLEDKIAAHIPDAPEAWRDITVRHLLSHTAGLKAEFMPTLNGRWLSDYTTAQMFEAAAKLPLDSTPGDRFCYSDTGYFLLGLIIENVSGKRYGEFLAARMFKPLGMTTTTLLDQWAIIKNFSPGYDMRDGQLVHNRRYAQVELAPSYGILSTARDFAKWEVALASGRLVSQATLERMWTPPTLNNGLRSNYGFGWGLDEIRNHRVAEHGGGTGTIIFCLPDDKLTVIVLANLTLGSSNNPRGIAHAVAAHYIPGLRFSAIVPQPDPDPSMTHKIRNLLRDIAEGTANPDLLVGGISEDRRGSTRFWVKNMESFTFLACDDVRTRALDRFGARVTHLCYYKQTTPAETRYYRFYLTPDSRVSDYWSHTELAAR